MRIKALAIAIAGLALGATALADELTVRELRTIGEGRATYLQSCAACHGIDARGGAGPNLRLITERDGKFNMLHVVHHVRKGSQSPHESAMATKARGEMPAMEPTLLGSSQNTFHAAADTMKVTHYIEFIQEPQ